MLWNKVERRGGVVKDQKVGIPFLCWFCDEAVLYGHKGLKVVNPNEKQVRPFHPLLIKGVNKRCSYRNLVSVVFSFSAAGQLSFPIKFTGQEEFHFFKLKSQRVFINMRGRCSTKGKVNLKSPFLIPHIFKYFFYGSERDGQQGCFLCSSIHKDVLWSLFGEWWSTMPSTFSFFPSIFSYLIKIKFTVSITLFVFSSDQKGNLLYSKE